MSQVTLQITYYVWAPDSKATDAPNRLDQTISKEHAEHFQALRADGLVEHGGAVLTKDMQLPITSAPEFAGSMFILKADSLEAARKLVEEDPFYQTGVWDRDNIKVAPVLSRA
ncbi:hypothetical protein DAEQUDRAFT_768866 [Daedalea quercina L-15889]|uniref:YCII-related domain-containing protein n=1 Tax=Daedalea quercina L-15889 TaxID=1314783 RepID=A0A165M9F4_9APHY|nr:hypothetical protein DAEQUDRAFT_768866 [Daedalea quercina L-15889]